MRHQAIYNIHPTVVSISGGSGTTQTMTHTEAWDKDGNVVVLDESKITTEETKLQAAEDAQAYARNRAVEYPSTGDQLDYIFHNGIAKWKTDIIEPVKAKYPKPS